MTRTHFTFGLFLLTAGLLGCSSTHDVLASRDGGGTDAGAPGTDGATPPTDGGGCPPAEAIECHRFITDSAGDYCCEQDWQTQTCVDGAWQCPDGFFEEGECSSYSTEGVAGCGFCEAQEASTYPVAERCSDAPIILWGWDGRACRGIATGCGYSECAGAGCGSLVASEDECVTARAACGAGSCEAQDVRFEPFDPVPCDDSGAITWFWNGWACERFVGCRAEDDACGGADCGARYATRAACQAARRGCVDQCDAPDASVEPCSDPGPESAYYVWNGHDCASYRSCAGGAQCTGSECDQVYETLDACRDANAHCVGPVRVRSSLTCGLDEDALVAAALRLGACGAASTNDVIGGYFELGLALPARSPSPGFVPDCTIVACAEAASSCAELDACLDARAAGPCGSDTISACVGDVVHDCSADELVPAGDCAALGGTCEDETTGDGRAVADCATPGNPSRVGQLTWCDGADLVVEVGGESVRLSCPQYLPGTECREIRYAGELPGYVCGYPSATCSEYRTSRVDCDGDEALLCVGGIERRVDCVAEGYARCEDGTGCVD